MTLTEALEASALAANLKPKDQAALQLARIYAQTVDNTRDPKIIADIGSKFHALLKDLGMTQAATATKQQTEGGAADDTDHAAVTFAQLRASFN